MPQGRSAEEILGIAPPQKSAEEILGLTPRRPESSSTPVSTGADKTFDLTGAEQIQVPTLGETRQAAERRASPRVRRAASLAQSVEGSKRRALDLFKQAEDLERRDPNLLATDEGAPGKMSRPIFDTATGRPYRRHETLRARAEAELETANRIAQDIQRDYSDLVEAGFGEDADPRQLSLRPEQRRRWAYVKPKNREVGDLLFTRRQGEASDRRTETGLRSLRRPSAAPSTGDIKREQERRELAPRLARGEPEAGQRVADKYRADADRKKAAGDMLGAQADYLAELQALKGVMKLTSAGDVGRQTQIRNSITRVERDLRGISGAIKQSEGKARPSKEAVDENASTAALPDTPLLNEVNNPGGGVPPRTEPLSGAFGRLARQQEAEREAAPQSRRKDTGVLSPVEYLKRKTGGEGIRVSDRGEAALLGAKEAGIVGLTNRGSKWTLSDAQVLLDEGGFTLDDGRRFTDESVTENDVLDFLGAYGKEGRLDTEGLDRRLAEEEAEFYANLPSEPLEATEGRQTAPLPESATEPESAEARPVREATPARRMTERLPVPKASEENIDDLRNRREQLSRLRYDRGELTGDLADEYRELGGAIIRFENEQAKAEGRQELAPPPRGDDRPFRPPSREDMRRAFAAAEARLAEETNRSSRALPKSDTELLERGRAAVDALFAEVEQDVDALDLLDRAIEGDEDARQELIEFADRGHAIDADTVESVIDARRSGRGQERGRIRQIAQARRGQNPDEAGAARYGADRPAVEAGPQARELSPEDLEVLNREPGEVADEDFDQFLRSLEALNNDRIRGLVELPEWATRQLEARIKQANEVRRGRVKEKRLGPKNEPLDRKGKISKKEAAAKIAEQSKTEAEETPTVVHPNPEIDRKPILAETNRGTVLVQNPNNKTGVSEVKNRKDEPAEHKFSSTQVNLPAPIADQIIAFGKRIPDADLADNGRENEPHITVKYGLHGWDAKFAEEALAGEKPAKVTFGKVSLFETNPDFDVVKVEVKSDDLHRLNKKVSESQPVTDTHPTYKPHATIAYVRKGRGQGYVGNDFLEGKTITLNSVTFSGRDGERVEIPLGAKAAEPAKAAPSTQPRSAGGGTYMGLGPGALQPLLDRAGSRIARRTKVPVPEDFDPAKYAEEVVEQARARGLTNDRANQLASKLKKVIEAVGDNDGWAVVDAHKKVAKILGSRLKSEEIGKIDAGVLAKLSTLRKAGFLARIPTHLRNIFGNTLFQQMEEVSRMPAAMMDTLLSLGFKRRTVAGPSVTAVGRAIGKAATTGLKEAGQVMKKGLTDAEAKEQQLQEVRFRNPVLDAYARYVFRSLSASDAVFFRGAYDRALSERARLRALNEAREGLITRDRVKAREKEILENPDLDLDLAAKEDARIAVFRNDNKVSDVVGGIRSRVGAGGNFAVDMVLPFDRTPSNIFVKTLEYTPLGYGRNLIQAGRAMINREFTPEQQREFAQTFGRATTGTFGVMLLGYVLAAKGLLTGFYDEEDKDREALRRAAGRMPASVRIGDRWYSVGGLAPLGTLLALGATIHRETHEGVKDEEERPLRSLKASSKFVFDLPLMRGTKDIVDAASQPGSLGQRLGRIGASFIPAPVADVGTLADDSQRDTASSLRGFRKIGSEFANEIRARLPVARTSLPPRVNVFGEPVRTEKSDVIDPFASRPAEEGVRGLRELLDLDLGLSKPQRERGETGEYYNARVRERGQSYKSTLSSLSDDEDARGMSRDARRAVFEKSLDPQAMERSGKLSDGSIRVERQIEGLRGDAYAVLGSMPEYRALKAQDQKAVRDLINKELERFKAEASSVSRGRFRREKRARVPNWTPAELAKAAVEARR